LVKTFKNLGFETHFYTLLAADHTYSVLAHSNTQQLKAFLADSECYHLCISFRSLL